MMLKKINKYFIFRLLIFCFCLNVNGQVTLVSKLPIINITTLGQIIKEEDKIVADMKVIDNIGKSNDINDLPTFESKIGIEIRGQTSIIFSDRLPFSVETRKSDGFSSDDVKLLGLPKENDWAFIAPYSDKTLIRDAFTYKLAKQIMPWAPSFKFAELVLNNEYEGVYMITEKIKKSKNRVNIDPMNPNENQGDSLTGGYIFALDKLSKGDNYFYSNISYPGISQKPYYVINYPKPELITTPQNNYISKYIKDFETMMNSAQYNNSTSGYPSTIEVDTFVNFFLINELTKNVDGYRLSTFFKKDRNSINPKLSIASVWDFNIALGNADYCDGFSTYGWAYNYNNYCLSGLYSIPSWLVKLSKDASFNNKMKNRWVELRKNEFNLDRMFSLIDSLKNEIGYEAIARNYKRYDILNTHVWPNPQIAGSYEGEITYLKNWLGERVKWIDGQFGYDATGTESIDNDDKNFIFPNPVKDFIHLKSTMNIQKIEIFDQIGRKVQNEIEMAPSQSDIPFNELINGIYFMKIYTSNGIFIEKFIKN